MDWRWMDDVLIVFSHSSVVFWLTIDDVRTMVETRLIGRELINRELFDREIFDLSWAIWLLIIKINWWCRCYSDGWWVNDVKDTNNVQCDYNWHFISRFVWSSIHYSIDRLPSFSFCRYRSLLFPSSYTSANKLSLHRRHGENEEEMDSRESGERKMNAIVVIDRWLSIVVDYCYHCWLSTWLSLLMRIVCIVVLCSSDSLLKRDTSAIFDVSC